MNYKGLTYLDDHLSFVAKRLGGKQLFVVGGAVRDILLGVNAAPQDVDMTLALEPDAVYTALQNAQSDETSLFRTEKFGTVTLIYNSQSTDHNLQLNYVYELTPFREESTYSDNRHPDEIRWSTSLISDAKRRDFTINCIYYTHINLNLKTENSKHKSELIDHRAQLGKEGIGPMAYDLEILSKRGRGWVEEASLLILQKHKLVEEFFARGEFHEDAFLAWAEKENVVFGETVRFVIDPFLGIQDLEDGVIRAVGDAEKRMQEDALRILRGVRLVNVLNQKLTHKGFDFQKETWSAMKKLSGLVPGLAKERLHQEIVKVFTEKNPFGWVALIDDLGLLGALFPALARNKYDEQPVRYHPFDTYSHILLTLWHLQQINDNYLVKLGMLYHDVGKKDQYAEYAKATTKEEMQEIHSSAANHVVCGPIYAEADFRMLGFSNKEIEEIALYVAQHMRPGQILMARPDNQVKRMRQMLSEFGYERVKNLLDITTADRRGQYNPLQSHEVDAVQGLYDILEKLYKEEGQFTMRDLAIDGNDVMQEFDLPPGPEIKKKLSQAFEWVLSDIPQRNNKGTILVHLHSLDR